MPLVLRRKNFAGTKLRTQLIFSQVTDADCSFKVFAHACGAVEGILTEPGMKLEKAPPRRFIRIVLAIIPWCAVAVILSIALTGDWFATWRAVRVTPLHIHFIDLQGFPTGIEVYRHGGDPLIANPLDPTQRPLNYPHLMLFLFMGLGINAKNLIFFAMLLAAGYLTCLTYLILHAKSMIEAVLMLIAGLSPVPLLAIMLANTDLLIFSLVFLAFLLRKSIAGPIVLFAATLLKIYPFAALLMYAAFPPAKWKKLPLILVGIALLVFAWRWREMDAIRLGTPIARVVSFGLLAIRKSVSFELTGHISWKSSQFAGWATIVLCWVAGLAAFISGWRKPRSLGALWQSETSQLFSFYAAIYVFCFAVGSNFNYRLIYLIPMIPFSIELGRSRKDFIGKILFTGCLLVALNWLNEDHGTGLLLACLVTLVIFVLTMRVLGEQLKNYLQHPAIEVLPQRPVLQSSHSPVA
jgi:hypothetical protein